MTYFKLISKASGKVTAVVGTGAANEAQWDVVLDYMNLLHKETWKHIDQAEYEQLRFKVAPYIL